MGRKNRRKQRMSKIIRMTQEYKDQCRIDFEKALDEAFDNGASGVSFFDGPSDEYLHRFKAYLDKKGLKTE